MAYENYGAVDAERFLVNLGVFLLYHKTIQAFAFLAITVLQTYEQIESMIATLNEEFMAALQRNNFSIETDQRCFFKSGGRI